jgi:hypothetical protein
MSATLSLITPARLEEELNEDLVREHVIANNGNVRQKQKQVATPSR